MENNSKTNEATASERQPTAKRNSGSIKAAALLLLIAFICHLVINGCDISEKNEIPKSYSNTLGVTVLSQPFTKNSDDLAAWAEMAYDSGWGYVYGTFGYVLSEKTFFEKTAQYPSEVGANQEYIRRYWLGRRTVDCMGLIKSYMWYDPYSDTIVYAADTMPDIGCDRLFDMASVKGGIKSIPEKPGLAVWCKGHIGVYIGNGYAIEAMSTKDGVKKTRVKKRNWTNWFEIPQISYS